MDWDDIIINFDLRFQFLWKNFHYYDLLKD